MEQKRAEVLEHLAIGHTRRASAHLAGVDEHTIRNWEMSDSQYSQRLREAEAKAAAKFEKTVIDAGASDPKIALAYLERRARADWGKQVQVEQSGALEITVVRKGRDTDNHQSPQ